MSTDKKLYKGNILFVDDSKVNLMMGSKMLSFFGLNVVTAENGQQAIDCCKRDKFDLIFMDLEMPEVDGLEAASIIREEKLSFAPIYALTGTESISLHESCRHAHMNGFIKKPLKKENILKVLNKVFLK